MKIRLTENKLKQIVAESVKNVLNEISSDLAYKASQAAQEKGRWGQGYAFSNYGHKRVRDELGLPSDVEATNNYISYKSSRGRNITLKTDGSLIIGDNCYNGFKEWTEANYENRADRFIRVEDKRLARTIANWCSKYIGDELPQSADWHFWAAL